MSALSNALEDILLVQEGLIPEGRAVNHKAVVALALLMGFFLGYKTKEWRMRWLKFKRDRLVKKLSDAQKKLDIQAPTL